MLITLPFSSLCAAFCLLVFIEKLTLKYNSFNHLACELAWDQCMMLEDLYSTITKVETKYLHYLLSTPIFKPQPVLTSVVAITISILLVSSNLSMEVGSRLPDSYSPHHNKEGGCKKS